MQVKTFFMVGMPESGKTTFLVSLCRTLMLAEIETLLKLESSAIPNGIDNIEDLMRDLGRCHEVGRTLENTHYDIEIPLIDKKRNHINLLIPDLSGEFFRDLVRDRRLKREIVEKLNNADEILFFINTYTMSKETRIRLQEKNATKLLKEETELIVVKETEKNSSINDTIKKKANQSELVDLLQGIVFLKKKKLRIKFIISAWDKVESDYKLEVPSPDEYIKKQLPLLYQYIQSNSEKFDSIIWGVSAQGGDFSVDEDLQKFKENNLYELIKVIDNNKSESNDLTKILCE